MSRGAGSATVKQSAAQNFHRTLFTDKKKPWSFYVQGLLDRKTIRSTV
jgi:hypothetical protein